MYKCTSVRAGFQLHMHPSSLLLCASVLQIHILMSRLCVSLFADSSPLLSAKNHLTVNLYQLVYLHVLLSIIFNFLLLMSFIKLLFCIPYSSDHCFPVGLNSAVL